MGSSLGATHSTPNETNDRGGTEAGRKIHKVYFKGSLGKAAIRDAQKKKKKKVEKDKTGIRSSGPDPRKYV